MRPIQALALGLVLAAGRLAVADEAAGARSQKQEAKKQRSEEKAKEGALKEKKDPKADLKLQEQNVVKLRRDADEDRRAGNRAGAWAADMDRHHAEKLIKKDKKLIEKGEKKQ